MYAVAETNKNYLSIGFEYLPLYRHGILCRLNFCFAIACYFCCSQTAKKKTAAAEEYLEKLITFKTSYEISTVPQLTSTSNIKCSERRQYARIASHGRSASDEKIERDDRRQSPAATGSVHAHECHKYLCRLRLKMC